MIHLSRTEKNWLRRLTLAGPIQEQGNRPLNRLADLQMVKWEPRPGGWISPLWYITDKGRAALENAQ